MKYLSAVVIAALISTAAFPSQTSAQYDPLEWTASAAYGYLGYSKSDSRLKDGELLTLRLANNLNRWISIEGLYSLARNLEGNSDGPVPNVAKTWTACLGAEALLHLVQQEGSMFDPFLAAGFGVNWYDHEVLSQNIAFSTRLGGGLNVRFSDEWALRADLRFILPGGDNETDGYTADIGISYSFGPAVRTYAAQPSSWDQVRPIAPVPVTPYAAPPVRSQPLPVAPVAASQFPSPFETKYEPAVQFLSGSNKIDPRYFPELDTIAAAIAASPTASARIEGHADKTRNSDAEYNRRISQARAQAVLDYFANVHGIPRSRMQAIGVGFDRPKFPNDPANGNPANRRVEVYITRP